jgi:CPA2 family monovalent cation:H+ antiporter-2
MHASPQFLVELGTLFLILGAAGAVAWRVGLSAVPLFLIAGLLVGEGSMFPAPSAEPFLESAAGIGVVLLMLSLGLEFSSAEFTSAMRQQTPSGVVDFVLNATPGFAAGLLLDLGLAGSLALAGITWVSSSGIVARTIVDLKRLAYRETPSVLSLLVLEDIAMAAYLPLLAVFLQGSDVVAGLAKVVAAVAAVGVVLGLSRYAEPPLARMLTHDSTEQVLLRVLGLTLVVAGAAELLGISAAVGAFLVGLTISGTTADVARDVLEPLRDLFAAAFFLSFGYATDPKSIWPVLPAALALAVLTGATKVLTGWYAAGRDGVGSRGRWRAGTVLIARGEFSIVIAGLAVAEGVTDLNALATAYVLLLAVSGPILTRVVGQRRDSPHVPHAA